jgi:tRNA-dihydrouridine synthase B
VKKAVSVPVIGNGDIVSANDAIEMLEQTGCDSVMIGRGALGNPWIFSAVKARLAHAPVAPPSRQERVETALDHIGQFKELQGEKKAAAEMKKHAAWYVRGLPGAAGLRTRIFRAKTTGDIITTLGEVLAAK